MSAHGNPSALNKALSVRALLILVDDLDAQGFNCGDISQTVIVAIGIAAKKIRSINGLDSKPTIACSIPDPLSELATYGLFIQKALTRKRLNTNMYMDFFQYLHHTKFRREMPRSGAFVGVRGRPQSRDGVCDGVFADDFGK